MLPLRITGLRTTLLLLTVGTISFLIASTPSHAEQPAEVPERESLRGLVGMEVLVEPLNIEIEQLGLQTVKLQSDIKQRLQKAGVRVLTEHERLATPTTAPRAVIPPPSPSFQSAQAGCPGCRAADRRSCPPPRSLSPLRQTRCICDPGTVNLPPR